MTPDLAPALCIDGVAVAMSGLRIDRRYAVMRVDDTAVPVEVIGVGQGLARVRADDGALVTVRVDDVTAPQPHRQSHSPAKEETWRRRD